jgi:hypothetical protein
MGPAKVRSYVPPEIISYTPEEILEEIGPALACSGQPCGIPGLPPEPFSPPSAK